MSEDNSIQAHGGVLINRITKVDSTGLFSITISEDLANDVENIADGIFSPLEGFLGQQDFESVVSRGRLANDLAWTIPIVLDVDEETASKMKEAGDVLLKNPDDVGVAVLHVDETFTFDKEKQPRESMVLRIHHTLVLHIQCQLKIFSLVEKLILFKDQMTLKYEITD